MLTITLLILAQYAGGVFTLRGIVRAGDSAQPIPGVLIDVSAGDMSGGGLRTWSDSTGRYVLHDVTDGPHTVRASRLGYATRTVDVFAAQDTMLDLDLTLTPAPLPLRPVTVRSWRERPVNDTVALTALADRSDALGVNRIDGDRLHANPAFGDADVLQALTLLPDVSAGPDAPTALHVRGGSGDQNLILLDGVPLYNASHAAGLLGAVNPDVVSSVTVHAGAGSARYGDALSGVIAVTTRDPPAAGTHFRGAVGAMALRQTVSGSVPGTNAMFVLSGRRSVRRADLGGSNQTNSTASFGDIFAKVTVPFGKSALELLSFGSSDRLAFDAFVDAAALDGPTSAAGDVASELPVLTATLIPRNAFQWNTGTQALVWRSGNQAPIAFGARAWRTTFDATADWAALAGPVRLTSTFRDLGVSGEVVRVAAHHAVTAGASAERIGTAYDLRRSGTAAADDALLPMLVASPGLVSVFLEDQWTAGRRWAFTVGARDQLGLGQWRAVEPRLSARFTPFPQLALSAGYARMHQYVQSLRNDESILDALVGIALPVAAGTRGGSVALADQVALSAQVEVATATTITLGGYARRSEGLLLVAPVSAQPFATDRVARGTGVASGATILLERRGARLVGHVAYAVALGSRESSGLRYRPSFANTQTLNAAVGYRMRPGTTLRAALWTAAGRPTSLIDGEVQWAPQSMLAGSEDMAGSPQRIVGALNGERLPLYARLDLGLRQAWRPELFGRTAQLAGILSLSNALDRVNALGVWGSADQGTRHVIPGSRRSLTLGLEWSY